MPKTLKSIATWLNPLERHECTAFIEWTQYNHNQYPGLHLIHHIPNGEKRDKATANLLKQLGVKPGVSDYFLPVPLGNYHGAYLEIKRRNGGSCSDSQIRWQLEMQNRGYFVAVCRGAEAAIEAIKQYYGKT